MTPEAHPAPPSAIPDYELLRLIGRGSYGDVWLARGVTGVYRAIKIVWRARFADAQPYEREFKGLTEFAAISLEESRQLALLHVGRTPEFFYYVMELADDVTRGREIDPASYVPHTLKDICSTGRGLPAAEAVRLAVDLAQALAGLHAHGLVHRDIKPSNVIFVSGVPKLADIGLVATASAALTFVGTEGYVPPEGPGAPAADVFSLGKVLYELSTGLERNEYPRLPADLHTRPDRKELLELNEIVIRACAPHPENRYVDAAALLDELRLLQAGKSVRRLRATERRLGRALRLAAVLAITAAVAGAGAWIEHRRAADAEAERDALRRRTEYMAEVSQTRIALGDHDYGGARTLLAAVVPKHGEPDLRGLEWGVLQRQAKGDPCLVVRESGPAINRISASPDRSLYAVHDDSGALALYRTENHTEVRRIQDVDSFVGFSSDGLFLIGTAKGSRWKPRRWHVVDGNPEMATADMTRLRPLIAHGADEVIGYVAASPAAKENRLPPSSPELIVWSFSASHASRKLPLRAPDDVRYWEFFRAAVSPDHRSVAIALLHGRQKTLQFQLIVANLETETVVRFPLDSMVPRAITFTGAGADSRLLVLDDVTRRTLEFRPQSESWTLHETRTTTATAHYEWVEANAALAVHSAQIIFEPDRPAGTSRRFRGHGSPVSALTPTSPMTFVSGSTTGELRVWSIVSPPERQRSRQIWNSRGTATSVVYSADGNALFVPLDGESVGILSTSTMELIATIPDLRLPIGCDEQTLWGIGSQADSIDAWDLARSQPQSRSASSGSAILQAAISGNRSRICYLEADGSVYILDTKLGSQPTLVQSIREDSWALTLDETGSRIWVVDNSPAIRCIEVEAKRERWSAALPAMASHIHWLEKAGIVVIALQNREIQFRDAATGALTRAITSGTAAPEHVMATANPFRVIAAGRDGAIRFIDPEFGIILAIAGDQDGAPYHFAALSPTATTLAAVGKSGRLQLVKLAD